MAAITPGKGSVFMGIPLMVGLVEGIIPCVGRISEAAERRGRIFRPNVPSPHFSVRPEGAYHQWR